MILNGGQTEKQTDGMNAGQSIRYKLVVQWYPSCLNKSGKNRVPTEIWKPMGLPSKQLPTDLTEQEPSIQGPIKTSIDNGARRTSHVNRWLGWTVIKVIIPYFQFCVDSR